MATPNGPNGGVSVVQDPSKKKDVYVWSQPLKEGEHQNPEPPKFSDAVNSIDFSNDVLNIAERPCNRQSLLIGIGTMAAVAGASMVARGRVMNSLHWGIGTGVASAAGSRMYCQSQRHSERSTMKRSIEMVKETRQTQAEELEAKRVAEVAAQQAALAEEKAKRSWYKFW